VGTPSDPLLGCLVPCQPTIIESPIGLVGDARSGARIGARRHYRTAVMGRLRPTARSASSRWWLARRRGDAC
jgi:hypothetical protein